MVTKKAVALKSKKNNKERSYLEVFCRRSQTQFLNQYEAVNGAMSSSRSTPEERSNSGLNGGVRESMRREFDVQIFKLQLYITPTPLHGCT